MKSPSVNDTGLPPFTLIGLPGLKASQHWVFLLRGALYTVFIVGNGLILFIVKEEQSLHQPMYYFLSLLSVNDLVVSLSTLPSVLATFYFHIKQIAFDTCMTQMFFIHLFSFMESEILLAMSFDHYVATCNPLRYSTILTDARVLQMGLFIGTTIGGSSIALPSEASPFCKANILSHAYCLYPDLIHLPCGISVSITSLAFVLSFVLDSVLILLSYILILCSVLAIAFQEEKLKTLNTCVSHICAVLIFYVPMLGVSRMHRYGRYAPPYAYVLMSLIYLFVPPMFNPVIYSIKTKEIRKKLIFCD
ncbi:olfactory receptor 51I1-like [Antechinus flavipes]|uniref:olfactory receptor 51I1-like n=1 Tax=Antechinus flavipes TaxID=38775 RepID=UPI002235A31F|nr:olfactory receptor 51I1-like [Antechinus flavipes]